MESKGKVTTPKKTKEFHLRRLTLSGGSRYLSVGTILPPDWEAVKLYVEKLTSKECILRLENIT